MPFCPKCRGEFQDWVELCPICKAELVGKLLPLPNLADNKLRTEKLVTVAKFSNPEEAYIIAARLESEGIRSFVANEFSVTFFWSFGEAKVQIMESDVEKALRILSITKLDIQADAPINETCPSCSSTNTQYKMFSLSPMYFMFLLILFISFVVPFELVAGRFVLPVSKGKWKCQTCGYRWKNRR
jgi:hypothetical protein